MAKTHKTGHTTKTENTSVRLRDTCAVMKCQALGVQRDAVRHLFSAAVDISLARGAPWETVQVACPKLRIVVAFLSISLVLQFRKNTATCGNRMILALVSQVLLISLSCTNLKGYLTNAAVTEVHENITKPEAKVYEKDTIRQRQILRKYQRSI